MEKKARTTGPVTFVTGNAKKLAEVRGPPLLSLSKERTSWLLAKETGATKSATGFSKVASR